MSDIPSPEGPHIDAEGLTPQERYVRDVGEARGDIDYVQGVRTYTREADSAAAEEAAGDDRVEAATAHWRPRWARPRLTEFTGLSDERPVAGDTSFAEGARQRGLDALRALRTQLPGSSERATSIGLRAAQYGHPGTSTPEELADRGDTTHYDDPFGHRVTTLRDPRDSNQISR